MIKKLLTGLVFLAALTACAGGKKHKIAEPEPVFSAEDYYARSMATGEGRLEAGSASLWSNGPQSLFGDRRARGMGDILTVVIEIDEEAEMQNSVTSNRQNTENMNVNALLGLPQWAENVLPGSATLNPAIDLERSRTANGTGNIRRQEKITLRLAARVVEVLPNGHMVVVGRQQIGVNHESRNLQVAGIVRPEDISRQNTITYDKIAEARIAYGGKGQVSDMIKPAKGSGFLQRVIPF